jgi:hypothetical protein
VNISVTHTPYDGAVPDSGPFDRQLRFAIAHKRLIEVRYGGRLRVAEPHDYGMKNGSPKVLVYQLRAGGSTPDPRVRGWRLLDLKKISICAVSNATFAGSRADASQQHSAWDELYARVG